MPVSVLCQDFTLGEGAQKLQGCIFSQKKLTPVLVVAVET